VVVQKSTKSILLNVTKILDKRLMMGELVLEMRDVSNGALKGVNLEVEKGDFCVVLAPSGSGKSTLLGLISRMEPLTSGQIRINGVDIHRISDFDAWRAGNIGHIYEKRNLIATLTAWENVELPLRVTKIDKAERQRRVLRAIERVGLKEKAGRYARRLTAEEEQRIALARAIAAEPAIILADEPTGRLKRDETADLIALMAALREDGKNTFVVATHDERFRGAASRVFEL
jgi:putative ABC transport system ATP-binding protein